MTRIILTSLLPTEHLSPLRSELALLRQTLTPRKEVKTAKLNVVAIRQRAAARSDIRALTLKLHYFIQVLYAEMSFQLKLRALHLDSKVNGMCHRVQITHRLKGILPHITIPRGGIMSKTITMKLSDVKGVLGDAVFETTTAFGYNRFGKYQPNMTFIIPKEWGLNVNGQPIAPTRMMAGSEVDSYLRAMNINFRASRQLELLFGDFWRSKKGGACFRPRSAQEAQHVLVYVPWGGSPRFGQGQSSSYAEEIGAVYFRRASSNGGRIGCDWWVLPIGFSRIIHDAEIDGSDAPVQSTESLFERRAREVREIFARAERERDEKLDAAVAAKAAL